MLWELWDKTRGSAARKKTYRIRVSGKEIIIEVKERAANGHRRTRVIQRVSSTPNRPTEGAAKYSQLREQFQSAAAQYRIPAGTLKSQRHKNAGAIDFYWKQSPAE